jgi:lipid-binding SYLF domain-containing protein
VFKCTKSCLKQFINQFQNRPHVQSVPVPDKIVSRTRARATAKFCVIACVSAAIVMPTVAFADKYQDTIETFREASYSSGLFDDAYGYAIFPNVGKGGFGVGAAYGKGKVFAGGSFTGDVSMSQLSIGFQMGGQAYSQIIFFEDKRAYDEFTTGSFEFGAQATAVAITLGVSAEASTRGHSAGVSTSQDAQSVNRYYKGMAVFTIAKGGLMYEASIGGQKFYFRSIDDLPEYKDITIDFGKAKDVSE